MGPPSVCSLLHSTSLCIALCGHLHRAMYRTVRYVRYHTLVDHARNIVVAVCESTTLHALVFPTESVRMCARSVRDLHGIGYAKQAPQDSCVTNWGGTVCERIDRQR